MEHWGFEIEDSAMSPVITEQLLDATAEAVEVCFGTRYAHLPASVSNVPCAPDAPRSFWTGSWKYCASDASLFYLPTIQEVLKSPTRNLCRVRINGYRSNNLFVWSRQRRGRFGEHAVKRAQGVSRREAQTDRCRGWFKSSETHPKTRKDGPKLHEEGSPLWGRVWGYPHEFNSEHL